jgi:hypothetical protein
MGMVTCGFIPLVIYVYDLFRFHYVGVDFTDSLVTFSFNIKVSAIIFDKQDMVGLILILLQLVWHLEFSCHTPADEYN